MKPAACTNNSPGSRQGMTKRVVFLIVLLLMPVLPLGATETGRFDARADHAGKNGVEFKTDRCNGDCRNGKTKDLLLAQNPGAETGTPSIIGEPVDVAPVLPMIQEPLSTDSALVDRQPEIPGVRQAIEPEPDIDYVGGDYRNFEPSRPDVDICREACEGARTCRRFTFVRPTADHQNGQCFLKSGDVQRHENPCCVSGKKRLYGMPLSSRRAETGAVGRVATSLLEQGNCYEIDAYHILLEATEQIDGSILLHNNPRTRIRWSGRDIGSHFRIEEETVPLAPETISAGRTRRYFNNVRGDLLLHARRSMEVFVELEQRSPGSPHIKGYTRRGIDRLVADAEFKRSGRSQVGSGAFFEWAADTERFRLRDRGFVPSILAKISFEIGPENELIFRSSELDFNFDVYSTGVAVRDVDSRVKDRLRAVAQPLVGRNGQIPQAIQRRFNTTLYQHIERELNLSRAHIQSITWNDNKARVCARPRETAGADIVSPSTPLFGSGQGTESRFQDNIRTRITEARQLDTKTRRDVRINVDRVVGNRDLSVELREMAGQEIENTWRLPGEVSGTTITFKLPEHLDRSLSSYGGHEFYVALQSRAPTGPDAEWLYRSNIARIRPVFNQPEFCRRSSGYQIADWLLSGDSRIVIHNNPNGPSLNSFAEFRGRRFRLDYRDFVGALNRQWYFNDLRSTESRLVSYNPGQRRGYVEYGSLPCNPDFDGSIATNFVVGKTIWFESAEPELKGYNQNGRDSGVRDYEWIDFHGSGTGGPEYGRLRAEYGIAIDIDVRNDAIRPYRRGMCLRGNLNGPPFIRPELKEAAWADLKRLVKVLTDAWDRQALSEMSRFRERMNIPNDIDLTLHRHLGREQEICYRHRTAVGSAQGASEPTQAPEPQVGVEMRRESDIPSGSEHNQ